MICSGSVPERSAAGGKAAAEAARREDRTAASLRLKGDRTDVTEFSSVTACSAEPHSTLATNLRCQ
ncbi:MAG: hypothetical protein QOK17_269 [Sphingomonadales bacterium]|nr:hypothetical protein [Sphingomonadales bacterium]